jgi:hypothetical protein
MLEAGGRIILRLIVKNRTRVLNGFIFPEQTPAATTCEEGSFGFRKVKEFLQCLRDW